MDRPALLHLYDEELRRQAPYFDDAMRVERDGPDRSVVRLVGATADAGNNCVLYSRLDSQSARAAIAQQIDYFRRIGHSFEWKHHDHDQPTELPQLLLEAGFVAGEKEACMDASPRCSEAPRWPSTATADSIGRCSQRGSQRRKSATLSLRLSMLAP